MCYFTVSPIPSGEVIASVMAWKTMLELRRQSNDVAAIAQLVFFALLGTGFTGAAFLSQTRPVVVILFVIPAAVGWLAVTRLTLALLFPFEYVCQFHADRVQWWTSRDPKSVVTVPVATIQLLEVDLDDLGFCWNDGSMLAQGIGVDVDLNERTLRKILGYVSAEWRTVRIFVIEAGLRRELSLD